MSPTQKPKYMSHGALLSLIASERVSQQEPTSLPTSLHLRGYEDITGELRARDHQAKSAGGWG